jgi:hypothetical protein
MKIIFDSEAEKELIKAQIEYINKNIDMKNDEDAALALPPLLASLFIAIEKSLEEAAK